MVPPIFALISKILIEDLNAPQYLFGYCQRSHGIVKFKIKLNFKSVSFLVAQRFSINHFKARCDSDADIVVEVIGGNVRESVASSVSGRPRYSRIHEWSASMEVQSRGRTD